MLLHVDISQEGTGMDAARYRRDGVLLIPLTVTPTLMQLNAICAELYAGHTRRRYEPKRKGDGIETVLDHNYDPSLLNIIFETGLADFMWANFRATLYHMQGVTSVPPGYQSEWHADCHVQTVHRLLYFPCFGNAPEVRSHIIRGTEKPLWANTNRLVSNRLAMGLETALLSAIGREVTVYSSDTQFALMNVESRHRAEPPPSEGAFRLMLSFTKWVPAHDRERMNDHANKKSIRLRFNHDLIEHYWVRLHTRKPSLDEGFTH